MITILTIFFHLQGKLFFPSNVLTILLESIYLIYLHIYIYTCVSMTFNYIYIYSYIFIHLYIHISNEKVSSFQIFTAELDRWLSG